MKNSDWLPIVLGIGFLGFLAFLAFMATQKTSTVGLQAQQPSYVMVPASLKTHER